MKIRAATLFQAAAALVFFCAAGVSAQDYASLPVHERGPHYEIRRRPDGQLVYTTGGGVPQWTFDPGKKAYVPFVIKKSSDTEEIRNGRAGLRITGDKVVITDPSGEEIRVDGETWALLRDGSRLESAFVSAETVSSSSEVVHSRRYSTTAGVYFLRYLFREGQPLKQEVHFSAAMPGEYSLVQTWRAVPEEISEDYPREKGRAPRTRSLTKDKFLSGKRAGGEDPPSRLTARSNGKHYISLETAGDHAKSGGYEADGAAGEMRFFWGPWTVPAGGTFVLDPIVYTNAVTVAAYDAMTLWASGASCPALQTVSACSLYCGPSVAPLEVATTAGRCIRSYMAWDVSVIPNAATVSSVVYKYATSTVYNSPTVVVNPMTNNCVTTTDITTMWNDAGDGAAYATFTPPASSSNQSLTLGGSANTDLQSRLSTSDQFCIGFKISSEARVSYSTYSASFYDSNPQFTLEVTYSAAAPTFFWVADSPSPARGGYTTEVITSSVTLGTGGTSVKMYVCKAADGTSSGCGAGGAWCSVTGAASSPSCSFTAPPSTDGNLNYYAYVYNDLNVAASNNPLAGIFTVDSTTPTITTVRVANDSTSPYADGENDSLTPVAYSLSETGSCRWYDTDSDYNVAQGTACSAGGEVILHDSADTVGYWSSMAVPSDGNPVISYYNNNLRDLVVLKCANQYCTASSSATVDSVGDTGTKTSIAIGADGLPVISYLNVSNLDLYVAKCGNASCSSGNTLSLVDSIPNNQLTAIAVLPSGLPVIAYNRANSLYVTKCGDAACSAGNTATLVDNYNVTEVSIMIGSDGLPFIAYSDTKSFKTAKCFDDACVSKTTTTIDSGNSEGGSVALNPDSGLPVILYMDDVGADFNSKLVLCADLSCTSFEVKTLPGTMNGTDSVISSIAIGEDGLPAVAYCDNGVYFVKCADSSCNSYWNNVLLDSFSCNVAMRRFTIRNPSAPIIAYYDSIGLSLRAYKCYGPSCQYSCLIDNAAAEGAQSRYISCVDAVGNYNTSADNLDVYWNNDFTPPAPVSVVSVSGDTSSPYVDTTTATVTSVVVSGETGMVCRATTTAAGYRSAYGKPCSTVGSQATCNIYSPVLSTHTWYVACKDAAGNRQASGQIVEWCRFPFTVPISGAGNWTWGKALDGLMPTGDASGWNWQAACSAGSFPTGTADDWVWRPQGGAWEWGSGCVPGFRAAGTYAAGSVASAVIPAPAGTLEDDVLVAHIAQNFTRNITPPSGWNLIRQYNFGTGGRTTVYYKVAGPSEPGSYTFALDGSARIASAIMGFSCIDTSNPIDTEAYNVTANGTSHSSPSLAASEDNSMVLALFSDSRDTAVWTPPANMTNGYNVVTGGDEQAVGSWLLQEAAGPTGTFTATTSANVIAFAETIVLRPRGGGAPPGGGGAPVTELGETYTTASGTSVTLTLTQDVAVGTMVVVQAGGRGITTISVSDSKGNTWNSAVQLNNSSNVSAVGIFYATISNALTSGDTITVNWSGSASTNARAMRALKVTGYTTLDATGSAQSGTTSQSATTSGAVTASDELLVGVTATGLCDSGITYNTGNGFTEEYEYVTASGCSSGTFGQKEGTGLSGTQTYSTTSSKTGNFSSVIATFK